MKQRAGLDPVRNGVMEPLRKSVINHRTILKRASLDIKVERDLRARWDKNAACRQENKCAFGEQLASSSEKPIHLWNMSSSLVAH
jgi:hypothetical protein